MMLLVYWEKDNEQDLSTVCDKCYEGNVEGNTKGHFSCHGKPLWWRLFKNYLKDEKSGMGRAEGQTFQRQGHMWRHERPEAYSELKGGHYSWSMVREGERDQVMHRKELEHYSKKLQVLKHKSIMALLVSSKYYSNCCTEKNVKVKRPQQLPKWVMMVTSTTMMATT